MSDMVFCRGCGATIHATAPTCPRCGAPQMIAPPASLKYGFGRSVSLCFNRFGQFSGRSPRSEYWYFNLFYVLVSLAAAILEAMFLPDSSALTAIVSLVLVVPTISVFVRRMHDLDRTGWWFWLYAIPIVGAIILLAWTVSKGTPGPNRYGPDPLAG